MFTPVSLPSTSPLVKDHNDTNSLQMADIQLTCLRQLLNDCNIPFTSMPSNDSLLIYAPKFLSVKETRTKARKLILETFHNNQASPALYRRLLGTENWGIDILWSLLTILGEKDDQEAIEILTIIGLLSIETGRLGFPNASVLVSLSWRSPALLSKLISCLLVSLSQLRLAPLAECIISIMCEYPLCGDKATALLKKHLCEKEVKTRLFMVVWQNIEAGSLPALFLLYRMLTDSPELKYDFAPTQIMYLLGQLKTSTCKIGQFPYVYMYLCLLHVLLSSGEIIQTLGTVAGSFAHSLASFWSISTRYEDSQLCLVAVDLLDIFESNLINRNDKYVHLMVRSILTIIFMELCPAPRRILDRLEKLYELTGKTAVVMDEEISSIISLWLSHLSEGDNNLDAKRSNYLKIASIAISKPEPVIFRLDKHPSSTAFFVPLLHVELNQRLRNQIKLL